MGGAGKARTSWARQAGGWALLMVGAAGCILPVIPGIPLALAGLIVLSRDYAWARRVLRLAKRRMARMRRAVREKRATQVPVPR